MNDLFYLNLATTIMPSESFSKIGLKLDAITMAINTKLHTHNNQPTQVTLSHVVFIGGLRCKL